MSLGLPLSADHRLALVRLKIDRAKHHLAHLHDAIRAFANSDPYQIGAKRDPDSRRPVYFLTGVTKPPPDVAIITGDVLQCARSALDHLAHQLVLVGGGTPTKNTKFPIVDAEKDYKGVRNKSVAGMRDTAADAIDAVRPYPDNGGNLTIWRLHRLNNIDKHRVIFTVGSAYRSFDISSIIRNIFPDSFDGSFPMGLHLKPADRLFPLKVNDELFAGLPDAEIDEKMKFTFDVAINEAGVVEGESLIETVTEVVSFVETLIPTFHGHLG